MKQTSDELVKIIREITPTVKIVDEKDKDRPLRELGVDSLDNMSFFLAIQEKMNTGEIPDSATAELKTINQIAEYVAELTNKK